MHSRAEDETNNFTLLRLILSLWVVFGHFKLLSGTTFPSFPFNLADAAVYAFFVVSGFLITGSYERSRGLLAFYTRRVFRLLPMYVFVVLVQTLIMLALLPHGPLSEPGASLRYLGVNLAFANFLQYDIGGVLNGLLVPGINPSLWTLKIEIGFYLIVPLIYVAVRRWGWGVLIAVFIASALFDAAMLHLGAPRLAKQLPGQMQYFAVGMGLYLYGRNIRVPALVAGAVSAAFLAIWTFCDPMPPVVSPLVVAAFVYCFALRLPVVRMRADLSYSVYLLHGPLIQTLILLGLFQDRLWFLAGIVATVLAESWVTEVLVEAPGNDFGKRLSRRLARPAIRSGPAPAVAAVPR